jgi:titin
MEDLGNYTVVAKNPSGEDQCTAMLTVSKKPEPEALSVRPMFRRLLSNMEIDEGYFARFDIRVKGFPQPDLKWEKDGKKMYKSEHVDIVWEDSERCYLLINNTFVTDSGLYKVTATNSAGTTSCQATLTVKPCTYQKRKIRENADRIEAEKRLKLAQRVLGKIVTTEVPLPQKARDALQQAAADQRSARTEGVDPPRKTGLEDLDIKKVEKSKKVIMPYNVPEAREIPVVVENKALNNFEPLTNMKWYRQAQIMNEKLGTGKVSDNYELTQHKKHTHVKQVLYPETDGMMPPRRPKNYDHQHALRDKIERVADILAGDDERERLERQKIKEQKEMEKDYLHRKIYREEEDDEVVLAPLQNYLDECRAQEIVAEEKYGDVPHFRGRAEIREGDEEFDWHRVRVPDKNLAGKSLAELNERRESLRKRTKAVEGTRTDDGYVVTKEDEMLRPARPSVWAYEDGGSMPKGTTWRQLEQKYKPIEEDEEPVKKTSKKNPYLSDEDSDELYGIPKPKSRMERYNRQQEDPSPERDYMKTARKSRHRDPEYDELDQELKKYRKTAPRYSAQRSPSMSPERFKPTRGEFGQDISGGMTFSAKRPKTFSVKGEEVTSYSSQPAPCVSYKPEFQLRLRKKTVPAGLSAKFTCSVRGRPDPEISWMKQESGIVLESGVKYNMTCLAGVASLTIFNCEERDMGTYRCIAKNSCGESTDYAQLEIIGSSTNFNAKDNKLNDSKFDASSYDLDFWTRSNAQKQWHTKTPSEAGSAVSAKNTINMPYFIRKPEDMELTEGDSTVIYCSCDAKPTAKVTWTKDGSAVQDSARLRIRSKGNQYRLEMDNVKFTDAGMYKIYAENNNGKAVASFRVDVNVRTRKADDVLSIGSRVSRGSRGSRGSQGPRLMQALQGQVRLDGTFRMECSVLDSASVRDAVWYKDDLRVSEFTDRVSLTERSGSYALQICDLKLSDSGSYACHLAGLSGGHTTTQFSITREQIQGHMNTIAKLKKSGGASQHSLPHSSRQSTGSRHSTHEFGHDFSQSVESVSSGRADSAPSLEPLPSDVDCSLGRSLVLTTSWKGQCDKVQWFVNGMEVVEDDKIRVDTVGCTSTLSILNASPDDAGLYRITVRNDNGSDSSEVVATIH